MIRPVIILDEKNNINLKKNWILVFPKLHFYQKTNNILIKALFKNAQFSFFLNVGQGFSTLLQIRDDGTTI